LTAVVVAEGAAIVLLTVLVAGLLRSHAEILKSLHELGAGLQSGAPPAPVSVSIDRVPRPAGETGERVLPPAIAGTTLDGEAIAVSLAGPSDTLIAFLSSGCAGCQVFWREFSDTSLSVPGSARLVVVTKDAEEESVSALRSVTPVRLTHVLSSQCWADFDVPGSPYFAYVDSAGRLIGEGTAGTWPHVANLLRQALAGRR
jgi:hypothetical protein